MSLGRIEAYFYSSGTAGVRSSTADLSLFEAVGPTGATLTLPGPDSSPAQLTPVLFTDALTRWQADANASVDLNNTYAITWKSASQSVKIARTAGASTFHPTFTGNLYRALGFSFATYADGTTFTGETQALGRFDNVRIGHAGLTPAERVDKKVYRHGRAEALCFSNHDALDIKIKLPKAIGQAFETSYCAAGFIRVYLDQTLAAPYSVAVPYGYVDGWVLSVVPTAYGSSEEWREFTIRLGVPRA